MSDNKLFYGDNLDILRNHIQSETVDLIYLDPPFNSNRNYNVLFRDESGTESEAQITAFDDTWHWGETAEATFHDLVTDAAPNVSAAINAMLTLIGRNQMMAYLVMMTARLVELHRVLKPTGSLYLHCDPTASHYLKIILDAIFGVTNFRNEITWKRTSSHNDAKTKFGDVADIILFYSKSNKYTFNVQYMPYSQEYIDSFYKHIDESGRRYASDNLVSPNPRPNLVYKYKDYPSHAYGWKVTKEKMERLDADGRLLFPKKKTGRIRLKRFLDEMSGVPVSCVWDDISPVQAQAAERLGYPTQKPVSLLERIIAASSNEGDIILDPFCGCGTAISAAQKLGRKWIGIDITHLSISLQKYRLRDEFDLKPGADYEVIGEPTTVEGAKALATDKENDGRYQFQFWSLSLIQAKPLGGQTGSRKGKKGADKGVGGLINFFDGNGSNKPKAHEVVVQVKSGKVKSGDIRDLRGTMERRKAAIGVFITLEAPSSQMETEAVSAGYYESSLWDKKCRKVQILTIEDLLKGVTVDMPPQHRTFKQAQRVKDDKEQAKLL
ncbi:MAG: DNA methyltransferase [Anaerolineae bacterium]|nr:DNA methyltransferase [Anaerolineae bacterium]